MEGDGSVTLPPSDDGDDAESLRDSFVNTRIDKLSDPEPEPEPLRAGLTCSGSSHHRWTQAPAAKSKSASGSGSGAMTTESQRWERA